jgi:multidrug resistance efflux pump
MSDTAKAPAEAPASAPAPAASDPVKRGAGWVAGVIVLTLLWYLLADRFTPYTQQARVQAFVVPVAAEVSGRVTRVLVRNNQDVKAGEVLFEVDREQASLQAAQANELKERQNSARLERLYREDPGTISLRRLEGARASREQAISQVAAARAEVQRAREQQGGSEEDNAQLRSAATALQKAELDLANTQVHARSAGLITDLRTEAGQFAAAGNPVMTLIAIHDVWISADMTENNLGLVEVGSPLDTLPGRIFEGRVRSIGYGVSVGQATAPGSLPTVQNSRDWLRPAQRFPVIVEFAPGELAKLRGIRVGGQAEVMAFPREGNLLNPLGRLVLRLMSWLSYAY